MAVPLPALHLRIDVRAPAQRRIGVTFELDLGTGPPRGRWLELFAPTWTPGSYLIREYARHFGPVVARDGRGTALPCCKSSKNRYRIDLSGASGPVRVDYHVYAHELTVRTADVTAEHAFWNHACLLLWPVDAPAATANLEVLVPATWDCASALPLERRAPGEFCCTGVDLDTLVDAPVLAGSFTRLQRTIRGKEHVFALDGLDGVNVPERMLDHMQRIVEQAADVFDGSLPYPHYTVLGLFTDRGYGGLEHADSTTLLAARTALAPGKSYQEFLGLFAHELFHAWNVKRMRPVELWRYDYEAENLTPMLWLAEGFTAYYDDLLCRRARVISTDDYLALIAKNLTALWSATGRFKQSLADASFDAWIRHYRPDENSRNSTQNYYGNGALVALLLDLTIRRATGGARTLDHALADLHRQTFEQDRGYRLDDVTDCIGAVAGQDLAPLVRSLTEGPLDPDFTPLLSAFGVGMEVLDRDRPYLGFAFEPGRTIVASVADDSPAFTAGVAPGDEVLALESLRIGTDRWAEVVQSVAVVGRPLRMLVATRGVVRERVLTPAAAPRNGVRLYLLPDLDDERLRLRNGWLGVDPGCAD